MFKNRPLSFETGIIFAGYGKNNIYPQQIELKIGGFYFSELMSESGKKVKISRENPSGCEGYGASAQIEAMIHGTSPAFKEVYDEALKTEFENFSFPEANEINKFQCIHCKNYHGEFVGGILEKLPDKTENFLKEYFKSKNIEYLF